MNELTSVAARASWTVMAGIIPGHPESSFTKSWVYTADDYVRDGEIRGFIFDRTSSEARHYVAELESRGLNWASLIYVWL